ncbi:methyl-accepting chemotaxis protein [Pseudomonas tohonis]|uniref:methyl-accepting chemotaxis protein n=1 Tax=Pseudomonas tohonis TaxID=2725477 RepID=UPI001F1D4815|nr:methyl-accepting chemotaxis protein [Pseudomonas tohonis]
MGASLATLPAFVEPPISRLAPDGRLLACNDAYLALCGYRRDELLNQGFELINHPQMPARVIERMWRTLRAGTPWSGPLMGRTRDGASFWSQLYVVPLFDGGELVALGTVYHPIDAAQSRRAEALYARLRQGRAPLPLAGRVHQWLAGQGLGLALALLLGGATLGGHVAPALGGLALALLIGAALQRRATQRRDLQRALGGHAQVYSDTLLAPIYRSASGGSGLFEMALNSQKLRMRTVMARISINGEILRARSEESAQLVASGAAQLDRQLQEAEQSAAAIHEMSATIQALSRNLQEAAQATTQVDQLAHDGERLAEQSQASMQGMRESVADIDLAVGRLAESIESISGIATVIQSIAEQTNLLALNAAIEAARAGESGRGFAVVADEVRTLASRTRDSTGQIQQSIQRLRDGSAEALATARRGELAAQQSGQDVEQVRQALQRICGEVGQISGMSLQMAAAIEQQGQVAEEVNRQIAQIAELAECSAGQAQRNSQIGQELHQLANSQLDLAQRFLEG